MTNRYSYATYLSLIAHDLHQHPEWRVGQTYFNRLTDADPELAEEIRGTDNDPFNNDRKLSKFLALVFTRFTESI